MTSETVTKMVFGSAESRLASQAVAKARMEQGLSAYKNPLERAIDKLESCRAAITAKCYECVGSEGNFREVIRTCTSNKCPLYTLRPYQNKVLSTDSVENPVNN